MNAIQENDLSLATLERYEFEGDLLMTEQVYALEFSENNRDRLAFVAEDRQWIAWTGTHWSTACAETLAERFFDEMIGVWLAHADQANRGGESKKRDMILERVKLAANARCRRNVLSLAQSKMMISRDAFDRDDAHLLNTPSGIVNLKTGAVTPCDPKRMLTRCTAVAYNTEAPVPERFDEIIRALAEDDEETFTWLWLAIGYTLTGCAHEDCVFFLKGSNGSNGKSTLVKALRLALGSYAHSLDIKFLTAGVEGAHSTEYAALKGKRMVATTEVEKGSRLSTSKLKDLTGGEVASPRDMYQSAGSAAAWAPELKLWMFGNHDLAVRGNDGGTWRRLTKIESARSFAKSTVRDTLLQTEGEGILKAAVDAAIIWYERGLGALPAKVKAATEAYRSDQDLLGKFFRDCLVFERGAEITKSELNQKYRAWLDEEGGDVRVGPQELKRRLEENGALEGRTKAARIWHGVRSAHPTTTGRPSGYRPELPRAPGDR